MADFQTVPVVDIHRDNFKEMWPTLMLSLQTSTYVALDTELSGLGIRKKLNAKSIEDRYSAMSEIAKTRSIVSIGMSCFRLDERLQSTVVQPAGESTVDMSDNNQPQSTEISRNKKLKFTVQTFNILLLCSEDFVVESASLRFLVDHGFDFNKQYAKGMPYYRGNDLKDQGLEQIDQSVRGLFGMLVRLEVPVIFHNALVDLVFLYHSFHATLPPGLAVFLADLAELFAGGTYDTKYIAEFQARMPASYLEYVFRKSQRENYERAEHNSPHVGVAFLSYPEEYPYVTRLPFAIREKPDGEVTEICQNFAAHGWCQSSTECPKSHDIDLILDNEHLLVAPKKRRRIRKRKKMEVNSSEKGIPKTDEAMQTDLVASENNEIVTEEEVMDIQNEPLRPTLSEKSKINGGSKREIEADNIVPNISRTGGHRAGFDAFMTGFIFSCFISQYGQYRVLPPGAKLSDLGMQTLTNKISLSGKDIPLQIVKSNFVKTSKDHREKMEKVLSLPV